MAETIYQEALDAYVNPGLNESVGKAFPDFAVKPLKAGLINQSFKVTNKTTGESFLLQKINRHVFPEPDKLQYNYETLWKYLQTEEIFFFIPEPKYFRGDTTLFCDSKKNYWRIFEFVEGTKTIQVAEKISEAKAVAESFAEFTASFSNFNVDRLTITIPDFHNLTFRFNQFKDSQHSHAYERLQKAASLVQELKQRERYVNFYEVITESGEFPKRVMHHDAKISNVLFDEESNEVICPVDFDTVMPGYFFSDIGDMIRSIACNLDEASTEFDKLEIRKDHYRSIVEGYSSIMNEYFTEAEKKYIHYSGIIMIYMQALRFITDYLNGDIYYRIIYPGQNFDRAMNQLTLLKRLEEFLKSEYGFSF